MKNKPVLTFAITGVAITLLIGMTVLAQQERESGFERLHLQRQPG